MGQYYVWLNRLIWLFLLTRSWQFHYIETFLKKSTILSPDLTECKDETVLSAQIISVTISKLYKQNVNSIKLSRLCWADWEKANEDIFAAWTG